MTDDSAAVPADRAELAAANVARIDPRNVVVRMHAEDRQQGQTTALLDVALANARRGLDVVFWSPRAPESREAFRLAARLADDDRNVETVGNSTGLEQVRYRSGGRVRFTFGHIGRHGRGTADMNIHDNDTGGLIERRPDAPKGF